METKEEKTAEQVVQKKEQNATYMRKYRRQQLDDETLREIQQQDTVHHQVQRAKQHAEQQLRSKKRKLNTTDHAASNTERSQSKRARDTVIENRRNNIAQQHIRRSHMTLEQQQQIQLQDTLRHQEERNRIKIEQSFDHAERPTTTDDVKDAEHDPKQALWKFYGNSGVEYFGANLPVSMTTKAERDDLHQLWRNNMKKEVVTTATVDRCIKNYNQKMWLREGNGDDSLTMQLQGCAACGIGDFNMDASDNNSTFKRVPLQALQA